MRDVGHEIPPHGFGLRQGGDVARQQQLVAITVGVQLCRELDGMGRAVGTADQLDVALEVLARIVGRERGLTDQIADMLQFVPLGIKAEMLRRDLVAPFDAPFGIEQYHAIG